MIFHFNDFEEAKFKKKLDKRERKKKIHKNERREKVWHKRNFFIILANLQGNELYENSIKKQKIKQSYSIL